MRYEFSDAPSSPAAREGPGRSAWRPRIPRHAPSWIATSPPRSFTLAGASTSARRDTEHPADAPPLLDPGSPARVPQPGAAPAGPRPSCGDRCRRGARGRRTMKVTGADAPAEGPGGRGRGGDVRHPRRRHHADVRPADGSSSIRHILVRHEQGAGHAAEGYAWAPARSACAWRPRARGPRTWSRRSPTPRWTRCRSSRSPARCRRRSIGTDAFQEADIAGITMPVTKHNFLVTDPARPPATMPEAFHIARTGRPGPVLIDVPKDVLQAETHVTWPERVALPGYKPPRRATSGSRRGAS